MKIDVIPFEGPIKAEVEGLQYLENHLPKEWFAYANCELVLNDGPPVEIDVLIVGDDRVFLVDLKNWRGVITADDKGQWLQNGRPRGGSASRKIRENAKKAGTLLRKKLGLRFFIDPYVLFSPAGDFSQLPLEDLVQAMSLADFCDPKKRKERIQKLSKEGSTNLYEERVRFDLHFKLRAGVVRARRIRPLGFELEAHPVWKHPTDLYHEYLGTGPRRDAGIVRVWDFSKLPLHLQLESTRDELLSREQVVREFLAKSSELFSTDDYTIQRLQSEDAYELYELPRGMASFRDFIGQSRSGRGLADVIEHIKTLVSVVAEIHRIGAAHGDIGSHSLWLGPGTRLKLSHLASAHIPDPRTLGPTRELLLGVTLQVGVSPQKRDVLALATLTHGWLKSALSGGSDKGIPANQALAAAFERVLAEAGQAECRFANALELLRALDDAAKEAGPAHPSGSEATALLQRYFRETSVAFTFPPTAPPRPNANGEMFYESKHSGSSVLCVKIFSAFSRSSAIDRLLPLIPALEKIKRISELQPAELPVVRDFGLAYEGLFVCYEKATGVELQQVVPIADPLQALALGFNLCRTIHRLHESRIPHGDLSLTNVLVGGDTATPMRDRPIVVVDAFDFPSAGGSTRVTTGFAPDEYESTAANERDAFALARLLCVVLSLDAERGAGQWEVAYTSLAIGKVIEGVLNGGWRDATEAVAKLLHHMRVCFEGETSVSATEELLIAVHAVGSPQALEPDGDRYYVQTRPPRAVNESPLLTITGLRQGVIFDVITRADGTIEFSRARLSQTKAKQLGWMRNHADRLIQVKELKVGLTSIGSEAQSAALPAKLAEWYAELSRGPAAIEAADEKLLDQPTFDWMNAAGRLSTHDVWTSLLGCERTSKNEVRVGAAPYRTDFGLVVPIFKWRNTFSTGDRVQVFRLTNAQEERSLGWLIPASTRNEFLTLELDDERIVPAVGEVLVLRNEREEAVRDRKCAAMERAISNESPIPYLLDAFDEPEAMRSARGTTAISVTHDHQWFKARYQLNDGQASAIRKCVEAAPLFLVQGPPGTGKTRLIASLVHYLVTELGYRNILVSSQTHEAVNNAAGTISDIFTEHSNPLDLVRVGREEDIADELLGVSTSALRTRFAGSLRSDWTARARSIGADLGLPEEQATFVASVVTEVLEPMRRAVISFEDSAYDTSMRAGAVAAYSTASEKCSELLGSSPTSIEGLIASGGPSNTIVALIARKLSNPDERVVGKLVDALLILRELLLRLRTDQGNTAFGEFLVRTNAVVCGTCVGIGLTGLRLRDRLFDWVIIDEAARCTASELAVALQSAKRIILVGDHLQLPPFIPESMAKYMAATAKKDAPYYLSSDFERIFRRDAESLRRETLTDQYRMVEPISNIVSALVYKPRGIELKTARGPAKEWAAALPIIGSSAVSWINTGDQNDLAYDDKKSPDDSSHFNLCEAKCIASLVDSLLLHAATRKRLKEIRDQGDWPIGIICTYASQVLEVEGQLRSITTARYVQDLIRIGTVDSYQGRENAIVIVSLVRSNPKRNIGYLTSLERSNVALSRAQERLILVGDGSTWGHQSNLLYTFGRCWHYIERHHGTGDVSVVPSKNLPR